MALSFLIPEFLKRRACRYMLHHYLGQYLAEKISLDDLTIDLYNGTGSVSNVPLNVDTINDALEELKAPVRVCSGKIGKVTVSVPWVSLLKTSSVVEVSGLNVVVKPLLSQYGNAPNMSDSLFFSMSTSRQMAEEVMKTPPSPTERENKAEEELEGFEGMDALARTMEAFLLRIQIKLLNTVISICCSPKDSNKESMITFSVDRIEFFDELIRKDGVPKEEDMTTAAADFKQTEFSTKILQLDGLRMEMGSVDIPAESHATGSVMFEDPGVEALGRIPVASVCGQVMVRATIKQLDSLPGPRLDIEMFVGTVHILLSPQQLHSLLEMADGLSTEAASRQPSGSGVVGHNRPIPRQEMRNIEVQLKQHIDHQQMRKKEEEESLQRDPWEVGAHMDVQTMTESSASSNAEEFYSFDLQSSYIAEKAPFGIADAIINPPSIYDKFSHPGGRTLSEIELGQGEGLQQLAPSHLLHPLSRAAAVKADLQQRSPEGFSASGRAITETARYSLMMGGLTCSLLEANPLHTHPLTTGLMPDDTGSSLGSGGSGTGSLGSSPEFCSIDEGGLDPCKYLESMGHILKEGVSRGSVKAAQSLLGQTLAADHLFLWMATVRLVAISHANNSELEVSVAAAELWEYLYSSEAGLVHIISPVSVQPLVLLTQEAKSSQPCLKLVLDSSAAGNLPSSVKSPEAAGMDVKLVFTHVSLFADVTLLDRLHLLLHPATPPRHAAGMGLLDGRITSSQQHQAMFQQAMHSTPATPFGDHFSLTASSNTVKISLKFPAAGLKDVFRPPWYRCPLRPEVLFIDITELTLTSSLTGTAGDVSASMAKFCSAKVYLSLDGSVNNRELFLCAQTKEETSEKEGLASIGLTIHPVVSSPLDDLQEGQGHMSGHDDFDELAFDGHGGRPSPFSAKKVLFSTPANPSSSSDNHSEELVMPGDSEEMARFESETMASAQYCVTCSIPFLSVHIPSKAFLENLYNRFATDLALWQPATPLTVEKAAAQSMFYSCVGMLQPAVTAEEKFRLCKSVLREEESDEEEECSFSSILGSRATRSSVGPTQLTISLEVERGHITMVTPTNIAEDLETMPTSPNLSSSPDSEETHLLDLSPRPRTPPDPDPDPSDARSVFIDVTGAHVFVAAHYLQEKGRSMVCSKIQRLELKHSNCGLCSSLASSSLIHCPGVLDTFVTIISPWSEREGDPCQAWKPCAGGCGSMLRLALDSKFEKESNRKINKLAVLLSSAKFEYITTDHGNGCLQELGMMFTLRDDVVPGYDAPTIITELHVHLQDMAIEYRPIHLPFHAVLNLGSLSVSSNLVTGSPLLLARVLMDQTYLFLSQHQQQTVNLKDGFVCVLDLGVFEMVLKLCQRTEESDDLPQIFSKVPEIDLQCSGSEIHVHLCVDSCQALRDLLLYLSRNGDLQQEPVPKESQEGSELDAAIDSPAAVAAEDSPAAQESEESLIHDLISDAMQEDASTPTSTRMPMSEERLDMQMSSSSKSDAINTTVIIFSSDSDGEREELYKVTNIPNSKQQESNKQSKQKLSHGEMEIEEDYCFLLSPTTAKVGPGSSPVVKCLLEEAEQVTVVDDHFSLPDGRVDQLQRPRHFPEPVTTYTIRELSITWHLYGGRDFPPTSPSSSPRLQHTFSGVGKKLVATSPPLQRMKGAGLASRKGKISHRRREQEGSDWKSVGGAGRDHTVLMEVELSKLRVQHETYSPSQKQSSRLVVLLHDLEVRDCLAQSRINKFLYQYSTESMPRQSQSNMFSLKVLFCKTELDSIPQRDDSDIPAQEVSVKLSVLPIRLNIDQDAAFFVYNFWQRLLTERDGISLAAEPAGPQTKSPLVHPITPSSADECPSPAPGGKVFIKSFVFAPELPIRIDYEGKRFSMDELGTLTGILLGLSHLDNSEVTLKAISFKQGVLGWDRLVELTAFEWLEDIKTYQLPQILKGVGPMYHVTQLVQGMVDLVWLPVQQYQEDGRIIWGLQRGANSFLSSSGVAVVELTNRVLHSVQNVAETAYDMVTPSSSQSSTQTSQPTPYQPADMREGLSNAYNVVTTGFGETARDIYLAATTEHGESVAGAMGGVIRQLPGAIVRPIILASEATRHVLGGVKNQFVPDAKEESSNKWKADHT